MRRGGELVYFLLLTLPFPSTPAAATVLSLALLAARGATAFNTRDAKKARKAILKASGGGLHAVVDFVGSSATVALAARL